MICPLCNAASVNTCPCVLEDLAAEINRLRAAAESPKPAPSVTWGRLAEIVDEAMGVFDARAPIDAPTFLRLIREEAEKDRT